ncbi:hypothetical protein AVEN_149522-1, partial [Araneus ventricosus]
MATLRFRRRKTMSSRLGRRALQSEETEFNTSAMKSMHVRFSHRIVSSVNPHIGAIRIGFQNGPEKEMGW